MKRFTHVFAGLLVFCFFALGVDGVWAVDDGTLKWKFSTGDKVNSSPAIGADGTIYAGSADGHLYAIRPDNTQKWVYSTTGTDLYSPAIGADGSIYLRSWEQGEGGSFTAVDPNGAKKWSFPVSDYTTTPAIGADGTIYVGYQSGGLTALTPDGVGKWFFPTATPLDGSPAIGSDGTIYVMGGYNFYAITPDGKQKWVLEKMGGGSSPAIGSDGTIYVGAVDGKLYAITPEGKQKWAFQTEGFGISTSPAIGAEGTIYLLGGTDKNLYALNPAGEKKWAFKTGGASDSSSPAIGGDGTIYVGSYDKNVYAIKPDGTHKWVFPTGDVVNSSPAIGPDGTVYVGSDDNNLYAINGSSGGLAHSAWPMFHRDLRHTGLSALSPVADIKANGHDGSITVTVTADVAIGIGLNAGSFAGRNADWYVLEKTSSDTFNYFDLKTDSMVPGLKPTYRGALATFGNTRILDLSDLTAGIHIFYFGVNLTTNGPATAGSLYYDQVRVTVTAP